MQWCNQDFFQDQDKDQDLNFETKTKTFIFVLEAPRDRDLGLEDYITVIALLVKTRSSADADNGLDAFGDQSRSPNIVPFHMLGIVSYCARVTLSKTRRFYDILQKCRDLEIGVKGHSRSLRVISFDRLCMVSY